MTRRRIAMVFVCATIAAASVPPWAHAETWVAAGVWIGGVDHGSGVVVLCASAAGVAALFRLTALVRVLGLLGAAATAFICYQLPDDLTADLAWQANLAWGAYVTLLGCIGIVVTAPLSRRSSQPRRSEFEDEREGTLDRTR